MHPSEAYLCHLYCCSVFSVVMQVWMRLCAGVVVLHMERRCFLGWSDVAL